MTPLRSFANHLKGLSEPSPNVRRDEWFETVNTQTSLASICRGFVVQHAVQQVVRQIHHKSKSTANAYDRSQCASDCNATHGAIQMCFHHHHHHHFILYKKADKRNL